MAPGFNLIGCDSWFTSRFWIFMTELFDINGPFDIKDKKIKLNGISMDLWYLNNMKVIWTLLTVNYVDYIIDSFNSVHNWLN